MIQTAKILFAVVLTMAIGGAMAHPLPGKKLPRTLSIDGWCETIEDIVDLGATYSGAFGGCGYDSLPAGGAKGNLLAGMTGHGGAFMLESYLAYGQALTFYVSINHTWVLVNSAGEVLNYGTWTAGLVGSRGSKSLLAR